MKLTKIGFGGGCHWCTEAVFQYIKGVQKVEQGWIASKGEAKALSEAVIVHFDAAVISEEVLIQVHLRTHKSSADHSFRKKYRSAIYVFSEAQNEAILQKLDLIKQQFSEKIITQVLPFMSFKASEERIQNYYKKNPQKPFCETYINPKLQLLLKKFSMHTKTKELQHLN